MKRLRNILFGLFALLTFAGAFSTAVSAEELWSDEYYRAYDETGTLTEDEKVEVDEIACEFVENYQPDIVMMTLNGDSYDDYDDLADCAEQFYRNNGFGYGADRDGIICAYDADRDTIKFVKFGAADERISDVFLEVVAPYVCRFYEEYKAFGIMYGFERHMQDYMEGKYDSSLEKSQNNTAADAAADDAAADMDAAGTQPESSSAADAADYAPEGASSSLSASPAFSAIERVGDSEEFLPYWYPKDNENFSFYNDPDAPRVVDEADIFTDEEEARMKARIAEISAANGKDIVIFTDMSTYGFSHEIYAADFYDFNGYGFGPENEGICMMICMDPEDRGWFATATGPESRALYDAGSNAQSLDDHLYYYMVDGNYGEGILDWIENIGTMYQKGIPFAPAWYPGNTADDAAVSQADAAALRVVDEAGMFTEEEIAALDAKAKAIAQTYGKDVVIHTAASSYRLGTQTYSDLFWRCHGFGFGPNKDGLLLTLYKTGGAAMTVSGSGAEKLEREVNGKRLLDQAQSAVDHKTFFDAANGWLKNVEHMERTGRVQKPLSTWLMTGLLAEIIAFLYSGHALKKAKKKMKTVRLATDADAYLVGHPVLNVVRDVYLRTYESRKPRPKPSSSGGYSGRSSGGSSYSHSYSGSSGRSHSGSGRSF